MNLFQRIFGKKEKDVLWGVDDIGINRRHHYSFAHIIFKKLFFDDPFGLFSKLNGDDGNKILIEFWNKIGEDCYPNERLYPKGLSLKFHQLFDDCEICLITLPKPKYQAEAYYIAIVKTNRLHNFVKVKEYKYFTLEYSIISNPIICEWYTMMIHSTTFFQINPNKSEFLEYLLKIIQNNLDINEFKL